MQDQPQQKKAAATPMPRRGFVAPPGIIFDSDMGRNIDTALALALLHTLGPKGRLLAAGVTSCSLEAARFVEVVARFYTGETPGGQQPLRAAAPVGLDTEGWQLANDAAMIRGPLALKTAEGQTAFRHAIESPIDTADVRVLYRNVLLSQKDGEGTVILAGPATNLAKLSTLGGAKDILAARVGLLVAALGSYSTEAAAIDPRVKADINAAKQLFETWPGPIVAVGTEVGAAVPYPGSTIGAPDFEWAPLHPVVEAYKAHRPMPYDAPAQALAAALYAGNQKEDFFKLSEPGAIQVSDDGRTIFTKAPAGKHRHLIVDPAQKEKITKAYVTGVSTKPAAPRRPF